MYYGALPLDMGKVDLNPTEMLYWMYCPIKIPGGSFVLPDNLIQFADIVEAVFKYQEILGTVAGKSHSLDDKYVYITAKTIWVSGECPGNRPGWHSDGFGTDDLNYIWYDRAPTEFYEDAFYLPEDCGDSMKIMEERAVDKEIVTYPDKHLLRLDQSVIHRTPVSFEPGMRTFVKISVSKDLYNLEGNSVNHELGIDIEYVPRNNERNHPHG